MSVSGSCLCGAIQFKVAKFKGPFEICHCNRCRKLSGSIGMPAIYIESQDFEWVAGMELIKTYAAPILYEPPAYHSFFCENCGCPMPPPDGHLGEGFEIPAGLLDADPGITPDKHIFVEHLPGWDEIKDDLPQYDIYQLALARSGEVLPDDFKPRTHYDAREMKDE